MDDLQLQDDKVGPLGLYPCHPYLAISQYFSLSDKGELRKENFCSEAFPNHNVQLTQCHSHKREQYWIYFKNGTIYNPSYKKCLSSEGVSDGKGLLIDDCKGGAFQTWSWTFVNKTVVVY